jgi:hypothetical protein
MNLSKLARIVGLSLALSVTALTASANPPAPDPCGCTYCAHANPNRSCTSDGTTMTCGYFLAVTLCQGS